MVENRVHHTAPQRLRLCTARLHATPIWSCEVEIVRDRKQSLERCCIRSLHKRKFQTLTFSWCEQVQVYPWCEAQVMDVLLPREISACE